MLRRGRKEERGDRACCAECAHKFPTSPHYLLRFGSTSQRLFLHSGGKITLMFWRQLKWTSLLLISKYFTMQDFFSCGSNVNGNVLPYGASHFSQLATLYWAGWTQLSPGLASSLLNNSPPKTSCPCSYKWGHGALLWNCPSGIPKDWFGGSASGLAIQKHRYFWWRTHHRRAGEGGDLVGGPRRSSGAVKQHRRGVLYQGTQMLFITESPFI